MDRSIEHRAKFDLIRYANCWEDADILVEALRPEPGKRILSIASGGDNSFSLLTGGAEVVAADLSSVQLACCELRRAAFANLDHDGVLRFLGVKDSDNRVSVYRKLSGELPPFARQYWDQNPDILANGFIHAGKFENYFRKFRIRILPLIHSKKHILELLHEKSVEQRKSFYRQKWNTIRWRLLFRIFFSKFVMGRLGRDPEFFRFVEGSVAKRILARTKYALTELPTHNNPYLNYILTCNYGDALPHYLRAENFDRIRNGLDRLVLFEGPIQEAAERYGSAGFDGFNLSDIFEYLDPGLSEQVYRQLLNFARPGARFAYWNMLVPREVPTSLADQVKYLEKLSRELFLKDKAWFYSKFIVEEKV